jgi:hypothetical protein
MDHDTFRRAWLDALADVGLQATPPTPEDTLELRTLDRRHSARVVAFPEPRLEPFTASIELAWRWTPLLSARSRTSEEDMLSELLGRAHTELVTELPWLRVDVHLRATLPWGRPIPVPNGASLTRWQLAVATALQPFLRTRAERVGRKLEAVHAYLGTPELKVACSEDGELQLLELELEAWRGVTLPRATQLEEIESGFDVADQLAKLAGDARDAFAKWKDSLLPLLPRR